jgi:hypothetical protein
MHWFIDTRNTVTKEHPFKLEKAILLKIYTAANAYNEFGTLLTVDSDRDLSELLEEFNEILKNHYSSLLEVFFGVFIFFIESRKEVDVFKLIIYGIKTMWKIVLDITKSYPCLLTT